MFTFGYLFSRMSWSNICFHRYFSQYLSLYEVFNVHSLRKAKPLEVSSKLLYQSTFISNALGSGQLHSFMFLTEWRWRDSNSWPPACKAGALPTELHPHLVVLPIFNFQNFRFEWAWVDSNHRPHAYQACALTGWAISPFQSGSHLLSHTVTSIVSSAAFVLTIVFGMWTGVSQKRIATRKLHLAHWRSML